MTTTTSHALLVDEKESGLPIYLVELIIFMKRFVLIKRNYQIHESLLYATTDITLDMWDIPILLSHDNESGIDLIMGDNNISHYEILGEYTALGNGSGEWRYCPSHVEVFRPGISIANIKTLSEVFGDSKKLALDLFKRVKSSHETFLHCHKYWINAIFKFVTPPKQKYEDYELKAGTPFLSKSLKAVISKKFEIDLKARFEKFGQGSYVINLLQLQAVKRYLVRNFGLGMLYAPDLNKYTYSVFNKGNLKIDDDIFFFTELDEAIEKVKEEVQSNKWEISFEEYTSKILTVKFKSQNRHEEFLLGPRPKSQTHKSFVFEEWLVVLMGIVQECGLCSWEHMGDTIDKIHNT